MHDTPLTIAEKFLNSPTQIQISTYGNGLINQTYLVTTSLADFPNFILQSINRDVFQHPELIMDNLDTLTQYIRQKQANALKLKLPELIRTRDNRPCYIDNQGQCWRALSFIENSYSIETLDSPSDAEQVGFALGHFHLLVNDLHPASMSDTLPGFHITTDYLHHYQKVLSERKSPLEHDALYCVNFITAHCHLANQLEIAQQKRHLSLSIIHGDPKLNNFLFQQGSRKIISLVDLDTVKPGLVHYDIGDCIRSCCATDTSKVTFDLEICSILLQSYLSEASEFFKAYDYQYLYPAIQLLPFELGLRFFTDYLEGNRYFKINEPHENLHRAMQQFQLLSSIQQQEEQITTLLKSLS